MKKKCTRTTLKEEFDDLAALVVSSIKARERKKKTKRRRGDILKLSLSLPPLSLSLCVVVIIIIIISTSSSSVKILFLLDTNNGFLSPKEEKTQILLLVGASWKSVADETVRGGETVETSIIRSRAREE